VAAEVTDALLNRERLTPDEIATIVIRYVASTIREDDFAFTVEARGTPWDVYNFTMPLDAPATLQGIGMLAWRLVEGELEIGFFRFGRHHTAEDIQKALVADAES
jgi:hypothetical protein